MATRRSRRLCPFNYLCYIIHAQAFRRVAKPTLFCCTQACNYTNTRTRHSHSLWAVVMLVNTLSLDENASSAFATFSSWSSSSDCAASAAVAAVTAGGSGDGSVAVSFVLFSGFFLNTPLIFFFRDLLFFLRSSVVAAVAASSASTFEGGGVGILADSGVS